MMSSTPLALHCSPHPDDEVIGCPATLLSLQDQGWRVINLALTLGSALNRRHTRAQELIEACKRIGFECSIPKAIYEIEDVESIIPDLLREAIAMWQPDIICSPSIQDRHPRHESVARSVQSVIEHSTNARWWMWGLWGELPYPTYATEFDRDRLNHILFALHAHTGEIKRNNYPTLVESRARLNTVLGAERIFGFGSESPFVLPYVELLTEAVWNGHEWKRGVSRVGGDPCAPPTNQSFAFWMDANNL